MAGMKIPGMKKAARRRLHSCGLTVLSGRRYGSGRTFALGALAGQLAGAADRLGLLAGTALGRLLVMAAQLHLAEDAFALHLLLPGLQGLIDIVIAHQDLHVCPILSGSKENPSRGKAAAGRAF